MKTSSRLQSAAGRCALVLALVTMTGFALGADPPAPPAKQPGFFARLGNAIARFGDRSQRIAEVNASKKAQSPDGRQVIMPKPQAPARPTAPVSAPSSQASSENPGSKPETLPADAHPASSATATRDSAPKAGNKEGEAKVYPTATFLYYGRVRCPFPPYTSLDVEGLRSGSLAKDPASGQIFRVP